jgi:hypothetical protein
VPFNSIAKIAVTVLVILLFATPVLESIVLPIVRTSKTPWDVIFEFSTSTAASFLAVIVTLFIYEQKRPKLEIRAIPRAEDPKNEEKDIPITKPDGQPSTTRRTFLHVAVGNPSFLFMDRDTAFHTTAHIVVYTYPDKSVKQLPVPEFMMEGKWRENFVPTLLDEWNASKRLPRGFFDTRDIPPGKSSANDLDIAMKIDGDKECFGHNLEAEFYSDDLLRNRQAQLDVGEYLVLVQLTTAGKTFPAWFKLINGCDYANFELQNIDKEETERFRKLSHVTQRNVK